MTCVPTAHRTLEEDIVEFLEETNFRSESSAYHNVLSLAMNMRLKQVYDPTALYVRGKADRIAVHQHLQLSFLWDAKTNSGKYRNMAVEALPLAHYILSDQLGVQSMFIYRDDAASICGGFWADKHPPIWKIMIPSRWTPPMQEWFEHCFERTFPGVPVARCPRTGGSDDPFILVREEELGCLFDWKSEIERLVEDSRG